MRTGRIHPVLFIGLVLVLGLLMVVNLDDSQGLSQVPTETSLQELIYVTALALEAELQETGAYPTDLEGIGMDDEGLIYTRTREGYTLVAQEEGVQVEYRSGQNLEPFRKAFESLLPPFEEGR